jgi:hypothetical protein
VNGSYKFPTQTLVQFFMFYNPSRRLEGATALSSAFSTVGVRQPFAGGKGQPHDDLPGSTRPPALWATARRWPRNSDEHPALRIPGPRDQRQPHIRVRYQASAGRSPARPEQRASSSANERPLRVRQTPMNCRNRQFMTA